jgi:glycosyltransferase involved in cell wall biosynthesis
MKRTKQLANVAVIEPVGGHGGMDLYDYGMCLGLQAAGVNAALYTCDETTRKSPHGVVVKRTFYKIYGSVPMLLRSVLYGIGSLVTVSSAVLEGRRICHYHLFACGFLELFSILLARMAGRRVIVTIHDVTTLSARHKTSRYGHIICRLAHAVIVQSAVSRDELMMQYHLPPDKMRMIPHGNYIPFRLPNTPRNEAKRQLAVKEDSAILLFLGQIKEAKGLDVLINAMPLVLSKHPHALLVIAGRPWKLQFSVYERMIHDLGIGNRCRVLLKYLDDREIALLLSAASLIVLPYRRIYQSGISLLAMSYGKAIVASDIPGMVESIEDGETGWLFKAGSPDDLAKVINAALANPDARERIGHHALKKVERENDWFSIGLMLKDVYENLH